VFIHHVVKRERVFLLTYGYVKEQNEKSPFFRFLHKDGPDGGSVTLNVYQARVVMGCLGKVLKGVPEYTQKCGKQTFSVSDDVGDIVLNIKKNDGTAFTFQFQREEAKKLRSTLFMLSKISDGGVTVEEINAATLKRIIGHLGPDFETAYAQNNYDISVWNQLMLMLFGLGNQRIDGSSVNQLMASNDIPPRAEMAVELTNLNEIFD